MNEQNLCDLNEIKLLLARHGFRFSKNLGQNFLCDRTVPQQIADNAGITAEHGVLEIGPGIGALSAQLCLRAKKVAAIELDQRLAPILQETMADYDNFHLIHGNVLKLDLAQICKEEFGDMPVIACANLPYYITTPAIEALLECACFSAIVVMVQKEAAERICASAGQDAYCAFSVQTAYHAQTEIILEVPRSCFVPSPTVDSAVLRLTPWDRYTCRFSKKSVYRVIRAAFNNRRKTLANGLSIEYQNRISKGTAAELLRSMGLPEDIRGERLTVDQFCQLAESLDRCFASPGGATEPTH